DFSPPEGETPPWAGQRSRKPASRSRASDSVLDKQRRARPFSLPLKLSDVDKVELFTHARSQVKKPGNWVPRIGPDRSNCGFESHLLRGFLVNHWRLRAKRN